MSIGEIVMVIFIGFVALFLLAMGVKAFFDFLDWMKRWE